MSKRSLPLSIYVLISLSPFAHADAVDDAIRQEMARQHIPGVAVLITKNDQVVKKEAYGEADIELHVPLKPDMIFESGSIGKSFTATTIMRLFEEGKLSLDDPVSKYIDNTPETWKGITLRNLLGHTSGITDYATVPTLRLTGTWTTPDWFTRMFPLPLDFPTGTQFAYSNSNYLLLGLVVEKITGHQLLDVQAEQIFQKIAADHTFPNDGRVAEGRVKGYWPTPNGMLNGPQLVAGYGDGSWMNSCEDLAKFERALREGKLVKPESVSMMQISGKLPNGRNTHYGFGWFTRDYDGHHYISHGGNTGGFGSSITRVVDKDLTIIVMTNLASVIGDNFARKIAGAYDHDLAPKPLVESTDPNPDLSKQLQAALTGLAGGNIKQDILASDLSARLATGRGQMSMPQFTPFREVTSFAYCSTEVDGPDKLLRYRAKTKTASFVVLFGIQSDSKVFTVATRLEA